MKKKRHRLVKESHKLVKKKWKKSKTSENKSQNVNLSNKMQKARVRKLQTS